MINIAYSINNVPIRLTDERWMHIVENHDEMAGYYFDVLETVTHPDVIVEGYDDELWAVKRFITKKAMLVVYKERQSKKDGFVITAFFTSKISKVMKRNILWQPPQ
jgi:hypothetical protein